MIHAVYCAQVAAFFRQLDPLKRGTCTTAAFKRGLVRGFMMPFSARELNELAGRWAVPGSGVSLVRYTAFAEALHTAAAAAATSTAAAAGGGTGSSAADSSATAAAAAAAAAVVESEAAIAQVRLTVEEREVLDRILEGIRAKVRSKRVLMKVRQHTLHTTLLRMLR
jgi:hypothetical protein